MKPQILFNPAEGHDPKATCQYNIFDESAEIELPPIERGGFAILLSSTAEIMLSLKLDERLQRANSMILNGTCLVGLLPPHEEVDWKASQNTRPLHAWEIDAFNQKGLVGPLPPTLIGPIGTPLRTATRMKVKVCQEAGSAILTVKRGFTQLMYLFDS